MKEKMLSLKLFGPGDIRLVETDIPSLRAGEILLRTEAAAICGTDVRMWKNGAKGVDAEHPLTLGHEFAGTIVEVGTGVSFYEPGMRVGMQPNIGCGHCDRCVAGNYHLCETYTAFGINMEGAFAEYIRIPAEAVVRGNLVLLDEKTSAEYAALCEPLSCVYNGFSKCFVKPGEHALVIGAGPIGVFHAQLLHLGGAIVYMNDVSVERLADCKRIMPYVETYCGPDLKGFVMGRTRGQGLDVAITACPVPSVQAAALELMNYGGRINFFGGIPADKQPVPIDTNLVHYRELYLTGSTRSSIAQFRKCVDLVAEGLVDLSGVITHRYSLDQALEAMDNASKALGLKHVFTFPAA